MVILIKYASKHSCYITMHCAVVLAEKHNNYVNVKNQLGLSEK